MHSRSNDFGEVFFAICKSVGSAKALALWLAYKYKSRDLFEMRPEPRHYNDAHSFSLDYAAYSYVSKFADADFGIDKRAVALAGFTSSEGRCLRTNTAIQRNKLDGNAVVANAITRARSIIASTLGEFSFEKVSSCCRWGNGATATLSRRNARWDLKQSGSSLSVTPSACIYALELIHADSSWYELLTGGVGPVHLDIVNFNRLETVPKSAKTDRLIAAEATLNGYLQQGAGRYIRKALHRAGIDLSNQGVNQTWAEYAQRLDLATLDLSSASDTISRELVYALLPLDWAIYLDRIRSENSFSEEIGLVKLHKFSSMGNAATFELETLIFWALVSAASHPRHQWAVSCYGDDIICHQSDAPRVVEVLSACGFVINTDKSYMDGRFFESCGKHYFDGYDVTPPYQKLWPARTGALRKEGRKFTAAKGSTFALAELFRAWNRLAKADWVTGLSVAYSGVFAPALRAIERQIDRRLDGLTAKDFLALTPVNDDSLIDVFCEKPTVFGRRSGYRLQARTKDSSRHQLASYQMWFKEIAVDNRFTCPVTDRMVEQIGSGCLQYTYQTREGLYMWENKSIVMSLHSEDCAPHVRRQ